MESVGDGRGRGVEASCNFWLIQINSHEDLPVGRVQEIVNWFKVYKTYEGKPQNEIGFGEKIFSK